MRCPAHKKETVGNCNWCGKQICPFCIARKDGRKIYCDSCANKLSGLKRTRMPSVDLSQIQKKEVKNEENEKRKFILNKDGYLVLEQ